MRCVIVFEMFNFMRYSVVPIRHYSSVEPHDGEYGIYSIWHLHIMLQVTM